MLKSYASSPNVLRYFCGRCGAIVFFRKAERPELIDVAVGLLDAEEGSRAESICGWNVSGVSKREDGLARGVVTEDVMESMRIWREKRAGQ